MLDFTTNDRFYINSETISFIQTYSGSTFLIKYGGSAMKNKLLQSYIIQDIVLLSSFNINIILVHGGGYIIDSWLRKLNIEPIFHNGIRVTDNKTIEVVEMVLSSKVNKKLVSQLNQSCVLAVGLSGKDANLINASSISGIFNDYTGKIDSINPDILSVLLSNGFIPVISSVAADNLGYTYNINADTAASFIAASLRVDKYILITDTLGVLKDLNRSDTIIRDLKINQIDDLKSDGTISGGMIPKLDSCTYSISNGVKESHIIDGRLKHSLLSEIFTFDRIGSRITK